MYNLLLMTLPKEQHQIENKLFKFNVSKQAQHFIWVFCPVITTTFLYHKLTAFFAYETQKNYPDPDYLFWAYQS